MNPLVMKLLTQIATKENALLLFQISRTVNWPSISFSTEYFADRIAFHIVKYETEQRKINVV